MKLYFNKTAALYKWAAIPYYSFVSVGMTACRWILHDILPCFVNGDNKKALRFKAKVLKIREFHADGKLSEATHFYKFRKYLVQPTVNLPKAKDVSSRKDLKKAKQQADKLYQIVQDALEPLTMKELRKIAKSLTINTEGKSEEELKSEISEAYHLSQDNLKTAFDGICGMSIAQFASEKLKGKSWTKIVKNARKGSAAKTAGLQSLYSSLPSTSNYAIASSLYNVQSKHVSSIKMEDSNQTNLEKIAALKDGIYRLSFNNNGGRHGILFCKENGMTYIIDTNIGLLKCKNNAAESLLSKVIRAYSNNKTKLDFLAFEFVHSSKVDAVQKALLA